ncbi:MAG: hypothetical protein DRG24_09570 [Epsilonproteobacteria bacterium]|nr:MAG: hypothetical protein DRG24_09570 [Campylobacterota bacterium]
MIKMMFFLFFTILQLNAFEGVVIKSESVQEMIYLRHNTDEEYKNSFKQSVETLSAGIITPKYLKVYENNKIYTYTHRKIKSQ